MDLDFCGIPLKGKNCLPSYKVDLNFCGIPLEGKNCFDILQDGSRFLRLFWKENTVLKQNLHLT